MVKAGFFLKAQDANGLQNAQRAHAVYVGRVFGALKAHGHVALRSQVVHLIRLHGLDDAGEVAGVAQVTVVQGKAGVVDVGVLVDVVYAVGIE